MSENVAAIDDEVTSLAAALGDAKLRPGGPKLRGGAVAPEHYREEHTVTVRVPHAHKWRVRNWVDRPVRHARAVWSR